MNRTDYDAYLAETSTPPVPVIHVNEVPGPDRTLVYGYSRTYDDGVEATHTVHVYKRDGALHVVFYDHKGERFVAQSSASLPTAVCRPTKRAYPERCDLAFARLMRERDTALTFTTFDERRANADTTIHGLLIEETF